MYFGTRESKNCRGNAKPIAKDEISGHIKGGGRIDRGQYPL